MAWGSGAFNSCNALLERVEKNDPKLIELVILPMKVFGAKDLDRLSHAIGKFFLHRLWISVAVVFITSAGAGDDVSCVRCWSDGIQFACYVTIVCTISYAYITTHIII